VLQSRNNSGYQDELPPTDPVPKATCPRCGGATAPRRQTRRSHPFMPAPGDKQPLTCVDCGLDFEGDPLESSP
jgi:hypothetical protein